MHLSEERTNVLVINLVLAIAAFLSLLATGGVELLEFAPAQILVLLLATLTFWRRGFPRVPMLAASLLALPILISLVQMASLPPAWVAAIMPQRAALLETLLVPINALPDSLTLSFSPYDTRLALLRFVCYALVFLLAFAAHQSLKERFGMANLLLTIGVLEAAYGCLEFLIGQRYLLRFGRWMPTLEATGTFTNRNHFAGLLEMIVPFVLAQILFARLAGGSSRRSPWVNLIVSPLSSRLLLRIVLLSLLLIALVFSRSRMGILACLAGMFVVAAIGFLEQRKRHLLLVLALVLSVPLAYSLWIGMSPVVERFEQLAESNSVEDLGDVRLFIWSDTANLIRDYPWTGTGLGTYRWTSLHYQTALFPKIYVHAHNDYLEFASEIGIPAALLLFAGLWVLAFRVARRALIAESVREKTLAAGCAGALSAILIHSITDFNLQIPANAFVFSWIAGTALALLHKRSSRSPESSAIELKVAD